MSWYQAFRDVAYPKAERHGSLTQEIRQLYCVTEGDGMPVKIGISGNPLGRIAAMQGHTWRQLYCCWVAEGDSGHEAAIKYLMRDRCCRGEWFYDSDDKLKSFVLHGSDHLTIENVINAYANRHGVIVPDKAREPMQARQTFYWRAA